MRSGCRRTSEKMWTPRRPPRPFTGVHASWTRSHSARCLPLLLLYKVCARCTRLIGEHLRGASHPLGSGSTGASDEESLSPSLTIRCDSSASLTSAPMRIAAEHIHIHNNIMVTPPSAP